MKLFLSLELTMSEVALSLLRYLLTHSVLSNQRLSVLVVPKFLFYTVCDVEATISFQIRYELASHWLANC